MTTTIPVIAQPTQESPKKIGQPIERTEDQRLLQGRGQFLDDVGEPRGTLHAAFLRSPHAHARILSIDKDRAAALPGVVAIVDGADLSALTEPSVITQEDGPTLVMETLPVHKVRFVGDIVACVIAKDRYVAEDALELVRVEYERLTPHLNMFDAASVGDEESVDPSLANNLHTHVARSYGNTESAFKSADLVVEVDVRSPRLTHVPIETRGLLATWDKGQSALTLYTGQQVAHVARTRLAARLRLRENQVRIVSPDVGGAFGQKIPVYREDVIVSALAILLDRPVKWIEDRAENLLASTHARDEAVFVQAAANSSGEILGLRAALWSDFGAYAYFPPSYMLDVVGWMVPGAYRLANYEYVLNVALTNKCPAGPMRAPMSIVTWVTEALMEEIARRLDLPVATVRRRNIIRDDEQPYTTACQYTYEALSLQGCFERGMNEAAFLQAAHERGNRLVGSALVNVVEPTTYGSAWYKRALGSGSGHETARIIMDPSGGITVSVGINPSGQGYETSISQVVADELGVAMDDVRVLLGDTHIAPYGMGSRGSRGAVAGHGVVHLAAQQMRIRIQEACAFMFKCDAHDIVLRDGAIYNRKTSTKLESLQRVAWIFHMSPSSLPPGVPPGLDITASYDPPQMTFSNATHCAQVEVDKITGQVEVTRYEVWEDAGRVINPLIVDGQIQGGVVMGIGYALCEEVVYDDQGNNTCATFVDYLIPLASQAPKVTIHHVETLNPNTPKGMKGMSEGPVMGSVAALALAVQNALRLVNPDARVGQLPLHPGRVLTTMRGEES